MVIDGLSKKGLYRSLGIFPYGPHRYVVTIGDGKGLTIASMAVSRQEFREQWAITLEMEANVKHDTGAREEE